MIVDLEKFIEKERPLWSELDLILTRLEADPVSRMTLDQVKRLHYLYERASADLARITSYVTETEIRAYLESLVSRAYGEIHETRRSQVRFKPGRWLMVDFPQTFRKHVRFFYLSLAISLLGALFGGLALGIDPESKSVLMPFPHLLGDPSERVAREESATKDRLQGGQATFSTYLMTHNTRVSIGALALGMTWAIGTIVILFYNGAILGAVTADYLLAGEGEFLAGWLLPHGSIEIPAILLAGQAGLLLGSGLIGWGNRMPVKERMRKILPDLVTLMFGVAFLLVWAGVVESFLSQYHEPRIPYSLKIVFGVIELVVLFLFLARAGRGKRNGLTGEYDEAGGPAETGKTAPPA